MSQKVIAYNEEMVRDLKSEWRAIFAKMFRGLQPAASEPREQKGTTTSAPGEVRRAAVRPVRRRRVRRGRFRLVVPVSAA